MVSFKKAYEYQRLLIGKISADTSDITAVAVAAGNSLSNLAFVLCKRGEHRRAQNVYKRALKILRKHLPKHDHQVDEVAENMNLSVSTNGLPSTYWFNSLAETKLFGQSNLTCLQMIDSHQPKTLMCLADETTDSRRQSKPMCLADQTIDSRRQSKPMCLADQTTTTTSCNQSSPTCVADQTSGKSLPANLISLRDQTASSLLDLFDAIPYK